MKLTESLNDALNEQILHELSNSIKYMQVASYFEELQLKKLSSYFMKQSNHEKDHADKFLQHINDRTGGRVELREVDGIHGFVPTIESVADFYVLTEEQTTESIEEIYDLAFTEKSFIDLGFLQSMLNEQISEEDEANTFATKIKMCKDLVLFDATFGD
jgi:ferritin